MCLSALQFTKCITKFIISFQHCCEVDNITLLHYEDQEAGKPCIQRYTGSQLWSWHPSTSILSPKPSVPPPPGGSTLPHPHTCSDYTTQKKREREMEDCSVLLCIPNVLRILRPICCLAVSFYCHHGLLKNTVLVFISVSSLSRG